MDHTPNAELPVALIGAGPIGLAAAAHLVERGLPFILFEAGAEAGTSVRQWGHVHLFSPWRYNTDAAARRQRPARPRRARDGTVDRPCPARRARRRQAVLRR
ncbi:FAD-dependent oxidoreductase [Streptosporangium canum]|uniref:FAD-dependent oxidoreductase n=1 Tax=Streptosporangium canum TaxID=324952 RepID=UPI003F4CE6A9